MAVMRALDPAPEEALPTEGWRLLAVDAGRYAVGLQATVQLWNSTLQGMELLPLASPEHWGSYLDGVAAQAGCTPAQVRGALMRLTVAVEGCLRETAAHADEQAERISQATMLVKLAADLELFKTPGADGEAYAVIPVEQHREVWPLRVKGFRAWLAHQFYDQEGKNASTQAVQDALLVLGGKALFDGSEHPVFTRLAEQNGAIYLDLANDAWQAVEITATGWRVVTEIPVKFRRARGMLALPSPVSRLPSPVSGLRWPDRHPPPIRQRGERG